LINYREALRELQPRVARHSYPGYRFPQIRVNPSNSVGKSGMAVPGKCLEYNLQVAAAPTRKLKLVL
jgi:hypothetical protein